MKFICPVTDCGMEIEVETATRPQGNSLSVTFDESPIEEHIEMHLLGAGILSGATE